MCVIMCKASGQEFPPVEEIKNCCDSNGDGFGAMYNTPKGEVRVFKTMDKEAFIRWYETFVKKHPVSVALVCHMRIATHGSKKVENCHPWTDEREEVGFAHNGILQIKNRGDMTDSETFFRDLWLPAFKSGGQEAGDNAVRACIGAGRFCFLFGDGSVERWGNWEEGSVKDVWYTNSSWKKRENYSFRGCGGGRYTRSLGFGGYDEDDVDFSSKKKKRTIQEMMDWLKQKERWSVIETLLARYKDRIPKSYEGESVEDMLEKALTKDGFFPLYTLLRVYWTVPDATEVTAEDKEAVSNLSSAWYKKFTYYGYGY